MAIAKSDGGSSTGANGWSGAGIGWNAGAVAGSTAASEWSVGPNGRANATGIPRVTATPTARSSREKIG